MILYFSQTKLVKNSVAFKIISIFRLIPIFMGMWNFGNFMFAKLLRPNNLIANIKLILFSCVVIKSLTKLYNFESLKILNFLHFISFCLYLIFVLKSSSSLSSLNSVSVTSFSIVFGCWHTSFISTIVKCPFRKNTWAFYQNYHTIYIPYFLK